MEPNNSFNTGDNGKTAGIISYLTIVGWLIAFLAMHKDNKTELGSYQLRQTLLSKSRNFRSGLASCSKIFVRRVHLPDSSDRSGPKVALCDTPTSPGNVRSRECLGRHLLRLSYSDFEARADVVVA